MTTAEWISAHLRGRTAGRNQFLARCPCKDHGKGRGDLNPSLSITDGDDGKPVLNCLVGCAYTAIFDNLIRLGIVTEADRRRPSCVNGKGGSQQGTPKIKEAYNYCDEHGELLYQKVRTEPKGFFLRRPDDHGGLINNIAGARRVRA